MNRVVCVCILVASMAAFSGCGMTKQGYLAKGNALFAAGKYDDASLNYRKAIQKDLNFGEAYYRLGLTALKLNQTPMALEAFLHAVQLMPGNVDAKERFGDVCLSFYLADRSHPQALYTQITNISSELLSKNGNSYEGLMLKGYLAATDRKFPEAIEFLSKARRVDASNPGVATELVQALIQNGQEKDGEKLAMDLIARQKTSYGPIYDLLYSLYLGTNRAPEAENVLQLKVTNNPTDADSIIELARHYRRLEKPVEMQATLRRLLDDSTNFPKGRLEVGDFYLGLRDYSAAIRYYQSGLDANPEAKIKLAYQKRSVLALLGLGNKEEAGRLARQVVKENPADSEALDLHAGILLDSGKRENADEAVRELRIVAAQKPGDAGLLLRLGQAYRLKGDLDAAGKEFAESLKDAAT